MFISLIDQLFFVVLWIAGIVFILVHVSLLASLFRAKQSGTSVAYAPGNRVVEIVWTAIPVLILLSLVFFDPSVSSQVSGTSPNHEVEPKVSVEKFAWNLQYLDVSEKVFDNEQFLESQHP